MSLILQTNFFFRFGKTISVSMFAAAMLYSTPGLELSIYSTCKRISQKLMRNVTKFVGLIYEALPGTPHMPVIRSNMEEVVLQGPDGCQDVRIVNSYPSKVMFYCVKHSCMALPATLGSVDCVGGINIFCVFPLPTGIPFGTTNGYSVNMVCFCETHSNPSYSSIIQSMSSGISTTFRLLFS